MNSKLETLVSNSLAEISGRIDKDEEYQEQWRKNFEEKNHNFFKELTNAMKSLKKQLIREKFERKTNDDSLRELILNNRKHSDKLFEEIDKKFTHQEEVYDFKLKKNNEKWESHLQIEIDKVLDSIQQSGEQIRDEFDKKLSRKSIELGKEFDKKLTRESNDLKDYILKKKGEIEENYLQGLKDLENKL
jgi:transposase-like protein